MVRKLSIIAFCFFFCGVFMGAKSCDKESDITSGKVVNQEAFFTCKEDSQCTTVKADCCGCQKGGKQMAIAETSVENWSEKLSEECSDSVCAQMLSKDPSCTKTSKCNHGKCGLE